MTSGSGAPPAPGFTSEETEIYRPISQMAVFSMVLGVLSFLAFSSWYFWPIPVAALVVACQTSFRLERARREYAGQFLAKAAIVLSLIAGIGSVTHHYTQRVLIEREAHQFANEYLDLVLLNKIKDAYVMSIHPLQRSGLEDSPDQMIIRGGDAYRDYVKGDPVILDLSGKGAEAQVTFDRIMGYGYDEGHFYVDMVYEIQLGDETKQVHLRVRGATAVGGEWQGRKWHVMDSAIRPLTPSS